MSCSMTVDKHLTLSGKQSHFHAPIPQWRARQIKYYFHTSTGNSTVLMRYHNYGNYVTVNGKLRYLVFPPFDFDVVRAKSITFPSYYLTRPVCVCANNIRFSQIGNGVHCVALLRYINGRNDYFSASSLRQLRIFCVSQLFWQIVASILQAVSLNLFVRINPFLYFFFLLSRLHFQLPSTDGELDHLNITSHIPAI